MWSIGNEADSDASKAWRRRQKPDNEVPVAVPVNALLARTSEVAIYVCGMRAYRHGLDFTVEVRARQSNGPGRDLGAGVHGFDPTGDVLLLGVQFSDGRRCSNALSWSPPPAELGPRSPMLAPGGGGGSSRAADISYFLSPLPPAGNLTIICAWPSRGVPESRVVLNADGLTEAASGAVELWPWEEEAPTQAMRPAAQVPPESWFADLERRQ